MSLLILIIAVIAVIAVILLQRQIQLRHLKRSDIVLVAGAEQRYPDLPLGNYGIPWKFKDAARVEILFPKLTADGEVEYLYSWHKLNHVKPFNVLAASLTVQLQTALELVPLIKEHLQIESEIIKLGMKEYQVNRLASLVSTSDFYAGHASLYSQALEEITALLEKAEAVQAIYVRLIREALIGVQVAHYDPHSIRDSRIAFESRYRRAKAEYEHLKDTARAYTELLTEGSKQVEGFRDDVIGQF